MATTALRHPALHTVGTSDQSILTSTIIEKLRSRLETRFGSMLEAFKKLDRNSSGFLTRDEIEAVLFDFNLPVHHIDSLLREIDTNHDGRVSFSEFSTAMKPHAELSFASCSPDRFVTNRYVLPPNAAGGQVLLNDNLASSLRHGKFLGEARPDYELISLPRSEGAATAKQLDGYQSLMSNMIYAKHGKLRDAFRSLDANKDGRLNEAELKRAMRLYNLPIPERHVEQLFASLPLNVSREMLQQNKVLKVIGKKMTRKALAMIKAMADADKKEDTDEEKDDDAESAEDEVKSDEGEGKTEDESEEDSKYTKFWKAFGKYIKMGLIEDAANRTRLAKLLRYSTSKSGDKEIGLEEYVVNMKEDQKNIYYISGEDKESLLKSPSVEKLLSKDIEIIFMTDSVDEYTVQHLTEFEGKRLINASREGLKLEEGDVEKKREDQYKEMFKPLLDYAKETLGKKVEKVAISKHLVQSPVVVLSADYGWTAQMEKVMKSQAFADQSKFEFMKSKRMFEINPRHPMIIELNSRIKDSNADDTTKDMVVSLYLSAVVAAGYQLMPEDAQDFSERVSRMVTAGLGIEADAELAPELEVASEAEEEDADDSDEESEEEDAESTKDEL